MSAHSFPSLISDSSSQSRSSDPHELVHEQITSTSLTLGSTASKSFLLKDPENLEIHRLRTKVSKLEQDKFVLGDYAAELQSRIRQLERARMEHQNITNDRRDEFYGKRESTLSNKGLPASLSRPESPYDTKRSYSSLHRASHSLSAATSTTAQRAPAYPPSRGTPSPTPSQLVSPACSLRTKAPKRGSLFKALEVTTCPQSDSSDLRPTGQYESVTPTRRQLQAMYGLLSSDGPPDVKESSYQGTNSYRRDRAHQESHIPTLDPKSSVQDDCDNHDSKLTALTSKLDSIVLTSKLFSLSSSRCKASITPVSPNQRSPSSHTTVIPLSTPAPSSYAGNIFLDSPPSEKTKVQLPRKGPNLLSRSLGLEENRPHIHSTDNDPKSAPKSPARVSFSDHLFPPALNREEEIEVDAERTGRMWGSWRRKKHPSPLSFTKGKSSSSPRLPTPPPASHSTPKPPDGRTSDVEDQRREKRRSLAAGCLRTLVSGSAERGRSSADERPERRLLCRSRSETRRSESHSRFTAKSQGYTPVETGNIGAGVSSVIGKDEKKRITLSRVGSPMPKSRVPGHELERTSSMRSAGKWGQRGRSVVPDLTRRRTIHPMFSFERPGSTDAASDSSKQDAERMVDDSTSKEYRDVLTRLPGSRRPVIVGGAKTSGPTHHEFDASVSQATHTQEHSYASGHTEYTRSDPGYAPKNPMMRSRLGMQTHGTFAFEPAATVLFLPRSAPYGDADQTFIRGTKGAEGALSLSMGTVQSSSPSDVHKKNNGKPLKSRATKCGKEASDREYLQFCDELKGLLGDGEDWTSFKKYVRRFDLEVLSAEALVQRVKKLIDGHRSVDGATRLRLYEQFVKIVHDNSHALGF